MQDNIRQTALSGLEKVRADHLLFPVKRRLQGAEETMKSLDSLAASARDTAAQDFLRLSRGMADAQGAREGKIAVYDAAFSALSQGAVGGIGPQASLALQVYRDLRAFPPQFKADPVETGKKGMAAMALMAQHLPPDEQSWVNLAASVVERAGGKEEGGEALGASLRLLSTQPAWDTSSLSTQGVALCLRLHEEKARAVAASLFFDELDKLARASNRDLVPYLELSKRVFTTASGLSTGSASPPGASGPGASSGAPPPTQSNAPASSSAAYASALGSAPLLAVMKWTQFPQKYTFDSLLPFVEQLLPSLSSRGGRQSTASATARLLLDELEYQGRVEKKEEAVKFVALMKRINSLSLQNEEQKENLLASGASLLKGLSSSPFSLQTLAQFSSELAGKQSGKAEDAVTIGKFLLQELEETAKALVVGGGGGGAARPVLRPEISASAGQAGAAAQPGIAQEAKKLLQKIQLIHSLERIGNFEEKTNAAIYTEGLAFLASQNGVDSTSVAALSGKILGRVGATPDGVKLSSEILTQLIAQVAREGNAALLPVLNFLVRASKAPLVKKETIPVILVEGMKMLAQPLTVKSFSSMGLSLMRNLSMEDQVVLDDLLLDGMLGLAPAEGGKPLERWVRLLRDCSKAASGYINYEVSVANSCLRAGGEGIPATPSKCAEIGRNLMSDTRYYLEQVKVGRLFAEYIASLPQNGPEPERASMAKILSKVTDYEPYRIEELASLVSSGLYMLSDKSRYKLDSAAGFVHDLMNNGRVYSDQSTVAEKSLEPLKELASDKKDQAGLDFLEFLEKAGKIQPPEETNRVQLYFRAFEYLQNSDGTTGSIPLLLGAAPQYQKNLRYYSYMTEVGKLLLDEVCRIAPREHDPLVAEQSKIIRTLVDQKLGDTSENCNALYAALSYLAESQGKSQKSEPFLPVVGQMVNALQYPKDQVHLLNMALELVGQKARDAGKDDLAAMLDLPRKALAQEYYDENDKAAVARAIYTSFIKSEKFETIPFLASLGAAMVKASRYAQDQLRIGEMALKALEETAEKEGDKTFIPEIVIQTRRAMEARSNPEGKVRVLSDGLQELAKLEGDSFRKALLKAAKKKDGEDKTVEVGKGEVKVGDTTIPVNDRAYLQSFLHSYVRVIECS